MNNITQFWLVAALIAVIIIILLWGSVRRNAQFGRTRQFASDGLRDAQLAELELNIDKGAVDASDSEAMRQEIARAHARAVRRGEDGEAEDGPKYALVTVMGVCLIGALVGYNIYGAPGYPDMGIVKRAEIEHPSQEKMLALLAENDALPPKPKLDASTQGILDQLQAAIKTHPDVAEGYYHMRVLHYGTGNFLEASKAQEKFIALQGVKSTADDYAILAETLVLSVNGYVSPEAVSAIKQSLKMNPRNNVATFYMGLSLKQENKFADAKTVLSSLLTRNIENPEWVNEINRHITEIDVKINMAKGPSAADMANAAEMSDEDRQQMIGGMVDGLKARLAENGGTPDEWARLIGALRVLGRTDEATAILGEAQQKFPDNAAIKALSQ